MPKIIGQEVGPTGFGLMSLTWAQNPTPKEQAFAAMNAALASGANFWNGGQFYGTPDYNSLHLLAAYFAEYPQNASKVVLSIKGGLNADKIPDGSEQHVRQSVEGCLQILPPSVKSIDIFQCARVDPNTPIESTMKTLKALVDEGKIGAVGLSEVRAETIKKANQIVPIAAVEVEFSMFETGVLINGVASTCASLHIPLIAYSPLGKGILTGKITKSSDIPASSPLSRLDKFKGDNLEHNLRLVHELQRLTKEHQPYSMAQLALSWVRQYSERNGCPVILPLPGSSRAENVQANNDTGVKLTENDLDQINKMVEENPSVGDRGYAGQKKYLEG